jgi:hypothetical protein
MAGTRQHQSKAAKNRLFLRDYPPDVHNWTRNDPTPAPFLPRLTATL